MPKQTDTLNGQSFRSVIDVSTLIASDGKLPKKIKVLPIGEWNTMPYGPMAIDDGVCTQMVANFKADVRKAVPIDVDHDGGKAAGWINDLECVAGDGVYAKVEWTPIGKDLLGGKIYKLFSPEWSFDYVDPEKSTHHGAVLIAGSLTNRPLFKELPVLVASDGTKSKIALLLSSEDNKIMTLEEILKKALADRSAEEVAFLEEHKSELSEEQVKQLAEEVKPAETDEEKKVREEKEAEEAKVKEEADAKAKADAEKTPEQLEAERQKELDDAKAKAEAEANGDTPPAPPATDTTQTASEDKDVTIKASELKTMKEKIESLEASEKKLAVEKEITTLVANENGGKIMPVSKDKVVEFVLTCSETQKKAFLDIVNTLPEIKIAGQTSASGQANMTAQEEVNKLIADEMKANDKLTISEATAKVFAAHSDLAKRYDEELSSSKK